MGIADIHIRHTAALRVGAVYQIQTYEEDPKVLAFGMVDEGDTQESIVAETNDWISAVRHTKPVELVIAGTIVGDNAHAY